MKKIFVFLICLLVVALGFGAAAAPVYLSRRRRRSVTMRRYIRWWKWMQVEAADVPMELPSQGIVEAKHRTTLAAEVGGKIVEISDKVRGGRGV